MGRRSTPALLTIASSVYEQLRKDILSGALPPAFQIPLVRLAGVIERIVDVGDRSRERELFHAAAQLATDSNQGHEPP
mgnify:CR=1 FL=1